MGNIESSKRNLEHAVSDTMCSDPDCELHYPEVIEDAPERMTAMAWYMCGVWGLANHLARRHHSSISVDSIGNAVASIRRDHNVYVGIHAVGNDRLERQYEAVHAHTEGLITDEELVARIIEIQGQ